MSAFTEAVEHNLEGVFFFSVGGCPGCESCGIPEGAEDYDVESHFSWSACDSCGSTLGGDRHPAHGVIADSEEDARRDDHPIEHFDVCVDCLMFHANGDEPEDWR